MDDLRVCLLEWEGRHLAARVDKEGRLWLGTALGYRAYRLKEGSPQVPNEALAMPGTWGKSN